MEKIDNAIKKTNEQDKKFEAQNAMNVQCLKKLKESIKRMDGEDGRIESLFVLYEQCIRVDCKMKDVKSLLLQRKSFLSQESKSCEKYVRD